MDQKNREHWGIGIIYQRGKKGIWHISYTENGKCVRKSSYSASPDTARKMLRDYAKEQKLMMRDRPRPQLKPLKPIFWSRPITTRQEKAQVWKRSDGFCRYCGKLTNPFVDFSVDHIIPLARGGPHSLDNMDCACRSCNSLKSFKPAQRYRYEAEA